MRTLALIIVVISFPFFVTAQTVPPKTPAPATPATPETSPAPALNLEQEMEALYADAALAFNQGKFDVTLQKLGAIHTKTANRDFEKVMFLEGAAHYNLDQFDKTVEFLQKFVTTFPQSEVLNEAKLNLGRAYLKKGDEANGVKVLKEVAAIPAFRDQAGLEIAFFYKKKTNPDEALKILQVILKGLTGPPTAEQQQAILMAAEIYVSKGDSDNASAMMEKLRSGASADESIVQLNTLGVKIGDTMLDQKRYREALMAYQSVRRQSEIVRIQKGRISQIELWVSQIASGQRIFFMNKPLGKDEAQALLDTNKKILEEVEKVKDYDASIYYRLGQCFYEMERYYESFLAFKKIYEEFNDFPERHRALFGMIVCNASLKRSGRAYELCSKYLNEFPNGANITQVTDMLGSLAYESGNIDEAVRVFQIALSKKDADKERLNFMLGSVLFEAQKFDDARVAFQALMDANPKSAYRDDAEYRFALSYFFQNNSKDARRKFDDYVSNNPNGQYVVDARYRKAFIEFQSAYTGQGGSKEEARKQLEELVKTYSNDQNIGQVYALLGDIYSQLPQDGKMDSTQLAMDAYRNAVDKAKADDVLNYAIDAATNLMMDKGMWSELSSMWTAYYHSHKQSLSALKAIYWISRAKEREARLLEAEGKTAEAQKVSDEARQLVAEAVIPTLGNPANEQVEVLIQQLVTMMVPKKKSRASADNAQTSRTFEQIEAEFRKLLLPEGDKALTNGTASARVLYGRAMIARYMRDVPKFDNLISVIPDAAKADELSPLLLATLAEMLNKKGEQEKAAEYFNMLREKYPNSEFADKSPVGLGEIAFAKKEYQKALDFFNEAIDKYSASSSILDATLGKAKCLFALKIYEESEALYKTILSTREWRGDAHAVSLYMLGQIEENRKELEKAISFYQRVYLSQQKSKEWMAKAYLQAAKCSMQLSKKEEAVTLLRQMLIRKDIADQPVFKEAQQYLAQISG